MPPKSLIVLVFSYFVQRLSQLISHWGAPNNAAKLTFYLNRHIAGAAVTSGQLEKFNPLEAERWNKIHTASLHLHFHLPYSRFFYDVSSDLSCLLKKNCATILRTSPDSCLQIFTLFKSHWIKLFNFTCISVFSILSTFLCLFLSLWNTDNPIKKCNNQEKVRETLGEAKVWLTF